ncbi:response regulator transcription factor [Paenibacillus sp. B-A-8]|uniref:response regulator transcription factor n=1 Tax=Paenibacillus sp. B-A-8 TaxID=3400419 RepID=UPI003B026383
MYSVLIVDDEQAIRDGLVALLDWESLGFQVIDSAANAIEAKHKYELYSPDLMIIDIRMPGRDGLELVEELRALDPEMHIIILSGYADFHYAKRALSLGVDTYLLKPVDEDELQLYLEKLFIELNARNYNRKNHAAVKAWNREMLVQSLLMDRSAQTPPNMELTVVETGLLWDSYQVVLIRLLLQDNADHGPSTVVKARLAKSFEEHDWGIVFLLDSYLGVLLQPSFQKELVHKLMVQHIRQVVNEHELECIITAGDMVNTLEDIPVSYQTALARMKEHFFYDELGMIGPDSMKIKNGLTVSPEEIENKLESVVERMFFSMDTGTNALLFTLILEAGELMISADYSEMAVKSRYVRIVTYLLNKLSLQYKELSPLHSNMDELIEQIYKQTSLPQLQSYISTLLEYYAKGITRDDMEVFLKRMLDLIHRHYNKNLKLDTLADVFSYSSAYLGKLFKNSTGYSFNSYLDKVRMEKAKELLTKGYKIQQVANEVGFSDVDYFREKFKKFEGVSPSDYRRNN